MDDSTIEAAIQAVFNGDLSALRRAVEAGVDVHQSFASGNTLLRNAATGDDPGPLLVLLELGADPNHRSYYRSPVDKRFEAGFTLGDTNVSFMPLTKVPHRFWEEYL